MVPKKAAKSFHPTRKTPDGAKNRNKNPGGSTARQEFIGKNNNRVAR